MLGLRAGKNARKADIAFEQYMEVRLSLADVNQTFARVSIRWSTCNEVNYTVDKDVPTEDFGGNFRVESYGATRIVAGHCTSCKSRSSCKIIYSTKQTWLEFVLRKCLNINSKQICSTSIALPERVGMR